MFISSIKVFALKCPNIQLLKLIIERITEGVWQCNLFFFHQKNKIKLHNTSRGKSNDMIFHCQLKPN